MFRNSPRAIPPHAASLLPVPALPLVLAAALLALTACSDRAPDCTFAGKPDSAPSAGCFAVSEEGLLLVQGMNGSISLPGGSSLPGESAQCTAFRETWEETGLRLQPRELLEVFDTGFHLYRCERDARSGHIDPPPRFEVRTAFYLAADRFDAYEWRFEEQKALLRERLLHSDLSASRRDADPKEAMLQAIIE